MDFRGWAVHVESLSGEGAGAPVVFLHGFGSGSFTWRPLVQAGVVDDRPAVAFDRFGFGRTARPAGGSWGTDTTNPYSLAGAVELTQAVLDDTAWTSPAILVGHSAGALVAVATALAAPERVGALVLVAPAIGGGTGPPAGVAAAFRLPLTRTWAPAVLRAGRPFVGRAVAGAWHDQSRFEASGLGRDYRTATAEPGWAEALVELTLATSNAATDAVAARLEDITVPALVVAGEHDRIVSPKAHAEVARRLPNSRLVVLPDCGHVPHEEAAAPTADAIQEFLLSLPRA